MLTFDLDIDTES